MTKPLRIHRLDYPANRKSPRPWSDEDVAGMIHMREVEKRTWRQIDRILNRPEGGSANKYEKLRRVRETPPPCDAGGRIYLSSQQIASREARAAAANRMSLTAIVLGDPPPGFSALDRRTL